MDLKKTDYCNEGPESVFSKTICLTYSRQLHIQVINQWVPIPYKIMIEIKQMQQKYKQGKHT